MPYPEWEFERVAGPYEFSEGPVWDGEAVYFTDIPSSRIVRYDPASGDCEVFVEGTNEANGLKFGPDGALYACEHMGHCVSRWDREGNRTVVVGSYRGDRLNSPNDLAFDDQGRLWFTDPDYEDQPDLELGHFSVYRCDPGPDGWSIERVTHDTASPNGILVSPDGDRLYVAELEYPDDDQDPEDADRELRSYPIREDGSLGEYEVLHNFMPHRGIDGMCLDEDGNIVACAGWNESGPGTLLYVFGPEGRVLETHPYPGDVPTNCAFGDADRRSLYVTGHEGALYRARTDRRGYLTPGGCWGE